MNVPFRDRVLLAGAALLALGSGAGFGAMSWRQARSPHRHVAKLGPAGAPDARGAIAPATRVRQVWSAPEAQPRGADWLYDVFTPPEIFYHAGSREFTVRPPSSFREDVAQEAFGLELVSVHREPFSLQLVGYVGETGRWRGTFQNLISGEVFLASANHRVPELGLMIREFEVQWRPVASPESMTTRQRVATAVILDERTGCDVRLTHRERQLGPAAAAVVSLAGETGTREVRAGDTCTLGQVTYRINAIHGTPASLDVSRESPALAEPERRVLMLREPTVAIRLSRDE